MCLFSHILTTRAHFGTQILPKKRKRRYKLCKINVYGFVFDKMQHISPAEFRSINCLPTKERVHQCINKNCPFYLNEIFEFAPHCRIDTRHSFAKVKHSFRKTNMDWKPYRTLIPICRTIYPKSLKKTNNLNTFKYNVKILYLNH